MKNDVVSGLGDRFSIWSSKVQQFLIGPWAELQRLLQDCPWTLITCNFDLN
jgi:hypothetical protein